MIHDHAPLAAGAAEAARGAGGLSASPGCSPAPQIAPCSLGVCSSPGYHGPAWRRGHAARHGDGVTVQRGCAGTGALTAGGRGGFASLHQQRHTNNKSSQRNWDPFQRAPRALSPANGWPRRCRMSSGVVSRRSHFTPPLDFQDSGNYLFLLLFFPRNCRGI